MRFQCTCAYDGTDYSGWQSQPGGKTIQDVIEKRLSTILKTETKIYGSGRTDSGVHALGQVFHFDAKWNHTSKELHKALGSGLPDNIQISKTFECDDDFHARFSAKGKRYAYSIALNRANPLQVRYTWSLNRKLDIDEMRRASDALLGKHDFTAFAARRNDGSDEEMNPVKELRQLDIMKKGKGIRIVTEADGYLYKMVRMLTGALVEVGLGKYKKADIVKQLESKKHLLQIQTAPPHGLCLEKVYY